MQRRWVQLLYYIITFILGFNIVAPIFVDKKLTEGELTTNDPSLPSPGSSSGFFNLTSENDPDDIFSYPEINTKSFFSFLSDNTVYELKVRNLTGTWRIITSNFHLNTTQRDNKQKFEYDINLPYAGRYYLNFTFKMNVSSFSVNEKTHNCSIEYIEKGYPYVIYFNYSDIASLSNFTFVPEIVNGKFNFSIQRTVQKAVHLKLDPTVTVSSTGIASTSTTYQNQRKIVRTSNGVLYAVFYAGLGAIPGNQICLAESRNNGSTWSPFKYQVTPNVTGMRNQSEPSIAINSNNEIYIIWNGQLSGYNSRFIRFRKFYLSNTSFSSKIINLSRVAAATVVMPAIAIDSNDNAFISWTVNSSSVKLRKYWYTNNSFGLNYFNVTSGSATTAYYPNVLIDSSNNLFIIFTATYTTPRVFSRRFFQNNMTLAPKLVNITVIDSATEGSPTAVIDSSDNIYLVFCKNKGISASNLRFKRYWSSNNTWNTKSLNISKEPTLDQFSPSLMITGSNLSVLWSGRTNISTTTFRIQSSNYTSLTNTWSTESVWTKGTTGSCVNPSTIYAMNPIVGSARTNIPTLGVCGMYVNGTTLMFVNSSRVDWSIPIPEETWKLQGFWNISFKDTMTNSEQVRFNISFGNSSSNVDFGFWNISFYNTSQLLVGSSFPINNSLKVLTGIGNLSVNISCGGSWNISLYDNITHTLQAYASGASSSGVQYCDVSDALYFQFSKNYTWYVNATDGENNWDNHTYYFTTFNGSGFIYLYNTTVDDDVNMSSGFAFDSVNNYVYALNSGHSYIYAYKLQNSTLTYLYGEELVNPTGAYTKIAGSNYIYLVYNYLSKTNVVVYSFDGSDFTAIDIYQLDSEGLIEDIEVISGSPDVILLSFQSAGENDLQALEFDGVDFVLKDYYPNSKDIQYYSISAVSEKNICALTTTGIDVFEYDSSNLNYFSTYTGSYNDIINDGHYFYAVSDTSLDILSFNTTTNSLELEYSYIDSGVSATTIGDSSFIGSEHGNILSYLFDGGNFIEQKNIDMVNNSKRIYKMDGEGSYLIIAGEEGGLHLYGYELLHVAPPLIDLLIAGNPSKNSSSNDEARRYLNESYNNETFCNVTANVTVPSERYMGRYYMTTDDGLYIPSGNLSDSDYSHAYRRETNQTMIANQWTCTYTGDYNQISAYVIVATGHFPINTSFAIYSDDGGKPGTLLGYTYTVCPGLSTGRSYYPPGNHLWITANMTTPLTLNENTKYWLVFATNDSYLYKGVNQIEDVYNLLGNSLSDTAYVKTVTYNVPLIAGQLVFPGDVSGLGWHTYGDVHYVCMYATANSTYNYIQNVDIASVSLKWYDDGVLTTYPMTRIGSTNNWTYNVTGLTSGNWYTFDILATDEYGSSLTYEHYRFINYGKNENISFQCGVPNEYSSTNTSTDLYALKYIMYLRNASYTQLHIQDVLQHEQGNDGTLADTGYWMNVFPTDAAQQRWCNQFAGGWWNDNQTIQTTMPINNFYIHWWTGGSAKWDNMRVHYGRSTTMYDFSWLSIIGGDWKYRTLNTNASTRSKVAIPNAHTQNYADHLYRLFAQKITMDLSDNTFNSNSIYKLFIGLDDTSGAVFGTNALIYSNRSWMSFILFNVPDNATLAGLDSDSDTLSDYDELYVHYTHPFLVDTDGDGVHDAYDAYPNDYLDKSNRSSITTFGFWNTSFRSSINWKPFGFWNVSFSNRSYFKPIGYWNTSFSNKQNWIYQGFWNISFKNRTSNRELGFWNTSFKSTPMNRNFGYWNLSFRNRTSTREFGFWNTSFMSTAFPRNFGYWNISLCNRTSQREFGYWNVSFMSSIQYRVFGFWNISFRNRTASREIGFWNTSFSNHSYPRNFGYWNTSFKNSPYQRDFGYWNTSFSNHTAFRNFNFWNTSFSNPSHQRDFGYWNISFENVLFWKQQPFWNISFNNSLSYKDQGVWNISFSSTLLYKTQGFWNVSFKSTPNFDNLGFWNVSFSSSVSPRNFGSWNVSFRNNVSTREFGSWNLSFSNDTQFRDFGFWNISLSNSATTRPFGYWNISFSNDTNMREQGHWNVSFSNSPSFRVFGYWNISFSNQSYFEPFGFWNVSFGDIQGWIDQGYWNISFSNHSYPRSFGYWNVSFCNSPTWEDFGFWNISFMNRSSMRNLGYWNVSFSNHPYSRNFNYWNISFRSTTDFKSFGFWNISFNNSQRWKDQGFWNVSFRNSSVFATKNLTRWNISFRNASYDVVYVDDNAPAGWYNETHLHTIQEGVNTVSNHGTVYVWAGNYTNHVIINKTASVIGNGTTSILKPPHTTSYSIWVNNADHVNITGMNVSNTNRTIYVESSDYCTVNYSYFSSNVTYASIYAFTSAYGNYSHNDIRSNQTGIYVGGASSYTIISYNNIHNIGLVGIWIRQLSENCSVFNNDINQCNNDGIYVTNNNNTFKNNTIKNSAIGMLFSGSSPYGSKYSLISNNTMWNMSSTGIAFMNVNYSRILNNTINGNLTAISIDAQSGYNWIYNNSFIAGGAITLDEGVGDKWNTTKTLGINIIGGPYIGGNYYSDNTGAHVGDGFSVPYTVDAGIQDYYPLVYPHWDDFNYWNVSFLGQQQFNSFGFWNMSFCNQLSQKDVGYWNTSFSNSLHWMNQGHWNVSFINQTHFEEFGFWNLSFSNLITTQEFGFYNISFSNLTASRTFGFWNVSFYNWSVQIYLTDHVPVNASVGIKIKADLNVTANSSRGYKMNITWFASETYVTSWFYVGHEFNVTNGTYSKNYVNSTNIGYRYYWKLLTDDGHGNYNNDTLYYTTKTTGGNGAMYDDGMYLLAVGMLIGFILGPEIFDEYRKRRKKE